LSALLAAGMLFAASDGAYGRLDGDMTFVLGASGAVVRDSVLLGPEMRLRYLDVAGAAVVYEEAVVRGELRRAFLAGVELRPFFPIRFLKAKQTGRDFFDLTLDSLSLDVGTWLPQRLGAAAGRFGMYTGLAIELPLFARATGLWLRLNGQIRWAPQRLEGDDDPTGRSAVLGFGLSWHQVFKSGIVQKGDESLH
jgi:hypothetical protein